MCIRLTLLALALQASALAASGARAATIEVDTLNPVGNRDQCSLTSAAVAASENRSHAGCRAGDLARTDEIRFAGGVRGAIRLAQPIAFHGPVRVHGPGIEALAIVGHAIVAEPGAAGDFSIQALSMRSGLLLRDARNVEVQSVRFSGVASQSLGGSAIAAPSAVIGHLRVVDSELRNTTGELGAIAISSAAQVGTLLVEGSRFEGNQAHGGGAGALYVDASIGSLIIIDSDFIGNSASDGFGGAVAVLGPADINVQRSTFHDNHGAEAGAILAPAAYLRITNSSFLRNTGNYAAAILDGHGGSDIRFSAIVDNGSPWTYSPSIARWNNGSRSMIGNLLRSYSAGLPVCDVRDARPYQFNRAFGGYGCGHGIDNLDYLGQPLLMLSVAADRPRVPAPLPNALHLDRIEHWDCIDAEWSPIATDIRGRVRPEWYGAGADPYASCDIGPFELREADYSGP